MKQLQNWKKQWILIPLSLMLMLTITTALLDILLLPYEWTQLVKLLGICLIVYSLIYWNKYTTIGTGILTVGGLSWGLLYICMGGKFQEVWAKCYEEGILFGNWYYLVLMNQPVDFEPYGSVLVLLICITTALIIYLFTFKVLSNNFLFLLGSFFYGYGFVRGLKMNGKMFYLFLLTSLGYFYYKYYRNLQKKVASTDQMKGWTYSLISVAMIIAIGGVTYLAANKYPLTFDKFPKPNEVVKMVQKMIDPKEVNSFGGKLGIGTNQGSRLRLEVKSAQRVYLKANTRNIYTGKEWKDEEIIEESKKEQSIDTFELLWGSGLVSEAPIEELFTTNSTEVKFKDIRTQFLFAPYKIDELSFYNLHGAIWLKEGELPYLSRAAEDGFSYTVLSHILNWKSSEMVAALKRSHKGLYKERMASLYSEREVNTEGTTVDSRGKSMDYSPMYMEKMLAKLSKRATQIQEDYTQLPNTLPQRVHDLTVKVTQDQLTDYGKVKAIERYLATHYPYTLTPTKHNPEGDFVDQFLFEVKEGYCTYYATAMTVMVRNLGIPSRYVEGYVLPSEPNEQGIYEVTDKQAHTWVEVYFEGFGWIQFEPTAAYYSEVDTANTVTPPTAPPQTTPTTTSIASNVATPSSEATPSIGSTSSTQSGKDNLSTDNPDSNVEENNDRFNGWILVLTLTLLGSGGVGGYIFYTKKQITERNPRKEVQKLYEEQVRQLAKVGLVLEKGETLTEYSRWVDKKLETSGEIVGEMTKIYQIAQYSNEIISQEQQERLKELSTILQKSLKKYKKNK